MAPLKQGFVATADVMSYATRLHIVLRTLFELRRVSIEVKQLDAAGPLERLRSLYDVRFAIVDNERQLLLAVSFDRSWESYIQGIVDFGGPLLDLIFSHCDDYAGHSCRDGFAAFASWVRAHQVPCDFFYAGSPELTVDDTRYLTQLVRTGSGSQDLAASVVIDEPREQATEEVGYSVLAALYDLKKWFDGNAEETRLWNELARATIPQLARLDPDSVSELDVREWLRTLQGGTPAQPPAPVALDVDKIRKNVQANILTRCESMTHGLVALLKCRDATAMRTLLAKVGNKIKSDAAGAGASDLMNIGFTHAGLQQLPLTELQLLELPKEFREGMEARAGLLGDIGPINSPECWQLPRRNYGSGAASGEIVALGAVDAVLIVQGARPAADGDHKWSADHPLHGELNEIDALEGVEVLHVQALRRYGAHVTDGREHFGFNDQTSQPVPELPNFSSNAPQRDRLPLGEILLGYENARGQQGCAPACDDILKDGSFLVLRKLAQDVAAFEEFANENADLLKLPAHAVKSAIVGRDYVSGHPLVDPSRDTNDFDYAGDRTGMRCPLHAHIRRANPRPSDPEARKTLPRILRRGFPYGTRYTPQTAGDERGLFFMAYNASIAQQFEVIQRWINGGNSSGGFSGQGDLFSGTLPPNPAPHYIHANGSAASLSAPRRQLVRLDWGMYLFVPSLAALEEWSVGTPKTARAKPSPDALQLAWGRRILAGCKAGGLTAWKQVLEDVGAVAQRAALWAAICCDEDGVIDTPYGVLVGDAEHVNEVLVNGETFSVEEYGRRMQCSAGLQHLGVDVPSRLYDELATLPNEFAARFSEDDAFAAAHGVASKILAQAGQVHVERMSAEVLSQLARLWFGLPFDDATCKRLLITSKYVFQPNPEPHLEALALKEGGALAQSYRELVKNPAQGGGLFLSELESKLDPDARATAVLSLASGFFAATYGSTLAALDRWIESGELWRLPRDRAGLRNELHKALLRRQGPTVIHRTCKRQTQLGGVRIEPERRVVLGLGSAANADPASGFKWLFGGNYHERGGSPHACPAQPMAVGVMLGLMQAILEQRNLKRVRRFVLAYEPVVNDGQAAERNVEPPPPDTLPPRPNGHGQSKRAEDALYAQPSNAAPEQAHADAFKLRGGLIGLMLGLVASTRLTQHFGRHQRR
jgi:Dyp-type peroxidase family